MTRGCQAGILEEDVTQATVLTSSPVLARAPFSSHRLLASLMGTPALWEGTVLCVASQVTAVWERG